MTRSDVMTSRQLNLAFALLGSPRPRTQQWIAKHVDGYADRTPEALEKLIKRDVDDLRRVGVPAETRAGEAWIEHDKYELEPLNLTVEEATALGLVVDLSQAGRLGAFARSGWTKIAASGVTRMFDSPTIAFVDNDIINLDPDVLKAALACARTKTRMTFDFQPAPGTSLQRRTLDPWSVVPLNNKTYLVGWDCDRGQERVFRLMKVSNIRKSKNQTSFHDATKDPRDVLQNVLRGPLADAVVEISAGVGEELSLQGERSEGSAAGLDRIAVSGVERDWLVRTLASLAPHVHSITPPDIHEEVSALLRKQLRGQERVEA